MHETAKKLKRRGFLLLEGVLLLAVLSALSVGTTAIFSGQFNTMNAGKQASQAQQYASVEGTYVRIKGYPNVDDLTHDWKDMSDLVGTEDGANWESKVEVARTAKTDDGNEMKVVKLSVRKKGDIVSRFSEEIPLVSGMEVYTKDEIDTMFDTVDSEINNLNSDLDAFKNQTAANFTDIINNINTINGNLDTLRQMIEAEKATREAAINAEHNAWMAALQNEQAARTARDAELTSQISSLQDSLSKLQSALNTEISQRKAEDSKLEAADNNLQQQINKEVADRKSAITTLQNDVNSKYEELKNLYNNLKGRLDGSEFVKSKDSLNNIALKYEQKDGESTKSLHGYVDGVEVPLASQYMFPVGTIIPYTGDLSKIPYGWHVCDGSNGTPDLSGRFLEGTTNAPKTFKDAGLPNIIGDIHGDVSGPTYDDIEPFTLSDNWNTYGALSMYDARNDKRVVHPGREEGYSTYGMHFDASKSNPIYGASDIVQPASYTVYYIMRVK